MRPSISAVAFLLGSRIAHAVVMASSELAWQFGPTAVTGQLLPHALASVATSTWLFCLTAIAGVTRGCPHRLVVELRQTS